MHRSIATCLAAAVGAAGGGDTPSPRRHAAHILSFTGCNLTNALYRNHTSFIEDLAPETGRGVRVNYAVRFH